VVLPPASAPVPARRQAKKILPPRPRQAAFVILAFTGALYVIEFVNVTAFGNGLRVDGIYSRSASGLLGVLWAPLLHGSWQHLEANTLPVLLFGFLAMAGGLRQWIAVTAMIWLISGLGVWLLAPGGVPTIGASGLAFGWLAFLLVRGLFNRSFLQILVAAVLFFYWGSVLWGVLPGDPRISWQGHLFGALGGVLAAYLAAAPNRSGASKRALPGTFGM
jgi:membrane associated rhomboid family serine protease